MSDTKLSMEWWDAHAKPCSNYERRSEYADEFLKASGILPGESVFDMGCGSGTLDLPLADDGHAVFCADFSEKMLASVMEVAEEEGLHMLSFKKLAWEDEWDEDELPVCDLAFASRCLFDTDLKMALPKLSRRARRKVCISIPMNDSMFKRPGSPYDVGSAEDRRNYLKECISVICDMGYYPRIDYIGEIDEGKPPWAFISWEIREYI